MKTQFNKSEIFKAAWNYKRVNNWTLSAALKVAWKEAKNQTNGSNELTAFLGHSFYSAYLANGKVVILCQYADHWMLFDESGRSIETSIKDYNQMCQFDEEVSLKGYRNAAELFKAEGHKIEFKN